MANDDLQTYLASKYMSGPKADAILLAAKREGSKKRSKRKLSTNQTDQAQSSSSFPGMILRDADEPDGWQSGLREDEAEAAPVVENIPTFKTKASTESRWETVKPSMLTTDRKDGGEEEQELEDERPQIVQTTTDPSSAPVGGLQTAAELRARFASKQPIHRKESNEESDQEEETIYRDSRGKKIDTKQLRAEEKRRQERELEKRMKKMEWGKGLVQRDERKTDAEELSKIASQPFARTIDDKELNDELKGKQRWNDPAAAFLTKSNNSSTKSNKPKYNGPPPPPNRYGIPPGFRWDGVDRSNGFEKKLFQTGNDQKRLRAEAYNYSVDEM